MSDHSTDVVVVGAGLVGLGCAWRLGQRGLAVTLLDPAPAAAASHAAAGMLAPASEVTYGEEPLLRLSLESLRRFDPLASELREITGLDIGLRREGTLVVVDGRDRELLRDLHAFQTRLGLSATLLGSRELRRLEPMLSPALRSGLYVEGDRSVDNRRLAGALLQAAGAAGATLLTERAARVTVSEDRATGVVTTAGDRIAAGHVVLAAGPWSGQLAGIPPDALPPVRPVKGQILRLHGPSDLLPTHTVRGVVEGHAVYLVPRADGELVVGASVEDLGYDTTVTAGVVRRLLRAAHALLPGVDELELVETTAALRPGSPDNTPVVGPTALDGLTVATGHYRNGVLLTPLTADVVAGIVSGDDTNAPWAALMDPARFAPVPTAS